MKRTNRTYPFSFAFVRSEKRLLWSKILAETRTSPTAINGMLRYIRFTHSLTRGKHLQSRLETERRIKGRDTRVVRGKARMLHTLARLSMDLKCPSGGYELTMFTWCQQFHRSSCDIKRAYAINMFIVQKATSLAYSLPTSSM